METSRLGVGVRSEVNGKYRYLQLDEGRHNPLFLLSNRMGMPFCLYLARYTWLINQETKVHMAMGQTNASILGRMNTHLPPILMFTRATGF